MISCDVRDASSVITFIKSFNWNWTG